MSIDGNKSPIALPMTFTDLVLALREILALTSDVVGKVKGVSEATQRHKGKDAAGTLDVLSFKSNGSRIHLERIAAGQASNADFVAIADRMGTTGGAVEQAIEKLTLHRQFIRERFGLSLANELSDLIYADGGKSSIRLDLELLAQMDDARYTRDDVAQEAERILNNIFKLNSRIERIHDILVGLIQNKQIELG